MAEMMQNWVKNVEKFKNIYIIVEKETNLHTATTSANIYTTTFTYNRKSEPSNDKEMVI